MGPTVGRRKPGATRCAQGCCRSATVASRPTPRPSTRPRRPPGRLDRGQHVQRRRLALTPGTRRRCAPPGAGRRAPRVGRGRRSARREPVRSRPRGRLDPAESGSPNNRRGVGRGHRPEPHVCLPRRARVGAEAGHAWRRDRTFLDRRGARRASPTTRRSRPRRPASRHSPAPPRPLGPQGRARTAATPHGTSDPASERVEHAEPHAAVVLPLRHRAPTRARRRRPM